MLERVENVDQLEDLLSEPSVAAVQALVRCPGDILLLGAGGKMGPTLARMARRASDAAGTQRRIIAVSRFTTQELPAQLQHYGVEPICCDLTDPQQLGALPEAPNVIFMTGLKFGASTSATATRLMNVELPRRVCHQYSQSRLVAFSSGNVYGYSPVVWGGSMERDALSPVGGYAQSVVAREEVFTQCTRQFGTPVTLLRLNYACELRYGVLVDIARAVWNGQPIPLAMGSFNILWQGDANAAALAALDLAAAPPLVLNVTGPETLSVRRVAEQLGQLLGKPAIFAGVEAADALLNNAQLAHQRLGYPRIGPRQMLEWIADWVRRGGEFLDKPTHFEARDGNF
jgi:nucleoside-diphosphate-sugar epimerase